jgi:RNA polymerase sigma factor (sigma-70 family)
VQEFRVEEILDGIRNRNADVLEYIYKNFYHQINVFINKNDGNDEDAKDIYQDAILVIYQKIVKKNLTLNCSFNTYLYSVCRLLWLKQLEKKKLKKSYLEESVKFIELDADIISHFEANERLKLFHDHFSKLSYNCQKILELFLAQIQLKEIARVLGYKSEQYVKKRKHQCKEKLIASIKGDPRFKEIIKY